MFDRAHCLPVYDPDKELDVDMELLRIFFRASAAACILGISGGIFLALVQPPQGWYIGVCIALGGLGVWYAMAPRSARSRMRSHGPEGHTSRSSGLG